ncbi:hypothetical protein L5515_005399 [Caenorhabditis briggsae]|uniref:Uncharacterized protein n=1 Tax=Caenorhabditis briggsae TaxID=6238 RepID=A0AAE9ERM8_CAEBR|nr:hypothetical protein L5515_005399 [Caenorhabditis briggsae]
MRDVRSGLAGMLILVWVIISTILTRDSLHYKEIDFDKYPYHKMFKFISVIGIIHVSFAAYFIQSSIAYLVILILTVTSFIFSVDLYTVITAKSYMFRKHYHYDWVREEILYHEEIVQTPDGTKQTIQWTLL